MRARSSRLIPHPWRGEERSAKSEAGWSGAPFRASLLATPCEKGPRVRLERAPRSGGRGRSGREARAAAAAAGRIRIGEGEPGALHRRHVIDGDAVEILEAEAVDEYAHPLHRDDVVVLERPLLDVEAVLEAG